MNNQDIRNSISNYEREISSCYSKISVLERSIEELTAFKDKVTAKLNDSYDILDERKRRLDRISKYMDSNYVRNYIEDMGDLVRGVKAQNFSDNVDDIIARIAQVINHKQDLVWDLRNRISSCGGQIQYLNSCISPEEEADE